MEAVEHRGGVFMPPVGYPCKNHGQANGVDRPKVALAVSGESSVDVFDEGLFVTLPRGPPRAPHPFGACAIYALPRSVVDLEVVGCERGSFDKFVEGAHPQGEAFDGVALGLPGQVEAHAAEALFEAVGDGRRVPDTLRGRSQWRGWPRQSRGRSARGGLRDDGAGLAVGHGDEAGGAPCGARRGGRGGR